MPEGYITVSEYARIKGISKQAVYKQLNNRLKEFSTTFGGKHYISKSTLSEDELKAVDKLNNQQFNNLKQPYQPSFNLLEKQIEEKDKQIESLLSQIDRLTEQNTNLTEALKNSQIMLAAEKQEKHYLLSQAEQAPSAPDQDNSEAQTSERQPKEKKGFFSLFHRRKKED